MGGRKWTDEELVLLEELTEKYPLETVARRLNRTKEAVFLKRQRIGMGGYMANTDPTRCASHMSTCSGSTRREISSSQTRTSVEHSPRYSEKTANGITARSRNVPIRC